MKSIRAFIAIQLPGEIQKNLGMILQNIQPDLKDLVRWVPIKNIHITLKFLGNVPQEKLENLQNAIQIISLNFPYFTVEASKLGAFPTAQKARVIWVGIEPNKVMKNLNEVIEEEISKLGFPKEDRPFSPHLTLGRVNDLIPMDGYRKIAGILQKYQTVRAGSFVVNEITLFRSDLTPGGSIYTPLASIPIGGQDKVK